MNKEIKFLMKFDTSEFDRAIEKMQRQLKETYRSQDIVGSQRQTANRMESMGMGPQAKPSMEAYFKSMQSARREMDQQIQKYSKDQQSLLKDLANQEAAQKRLKKAQDDAVKGSKEELQVKRQLENVEKNLYTMREAYAQRNQTLNQAMDARQRIGPKDKMERLATAFGGGGMRGGVSEAAGMAGNWWSGMGMAGQAGVSLAAILGAAKLARAGGEAYTAYKGIPLQVEAAQGAATQNLYGREIGAAYGGTQVSEMAFMGEKQRARQEALDEVEAKKRSDEALSGRGLLGKGIGGTAIGVGMMGLSATGIMGSGPQDKILGMFFDKYAQRYDAKNTERFAENYAKAVENIKNQNPLKVQAVENFQQNYMRDLQFQRQTGLNYETFHGAGGFRERNINAGFTGEMGMEAAGNILGAGGSTRMAQNATLALQAQRGFDLTNAPQILGKLSGQLGDTESTKQAFVKMLAEGSRLGLDSSQFREENRRFMDASAAIIERSGTTSQEDIGKLLQTFGGFVGTPTVKGMEAAQTAYQTYVSGTSATQGPQGVMRAASFMRDPIISGMEGPDMASLAGIDMEHLTTDHPVIKGLAQKYGKPASDIVAAAKKAGQSSFHRLKKGDDLQSQLTNLRQQLAELPDTGPMTKEQMEKKADLQQQIGVTQGQYAATLGVEYPQLLNDPQALQRLTEGTTAPGDMDAAKAQARLDKAAVTLEKPDTGRPEDKAVAAAAESSRMVLENFQKMHESIVPAVDAIKEYNKYISEQVEIIGRIKDVGDKNKYIQSKGLDYLFTPKSQAQSGKAGQ